ncbi:hypothetical protein GW755_02310 [bacterium]|nr:hypothetical protein [bacterium]
MLEEIKKKLDIGKISLIKEKKASKIHYITDLDDTPKHINYRYTALLSSGLSVDQVLLEFVTKIDGEYVSFKELFIFKATYLNSYDPTVLEHVNLFLDLIHSGSNTLVVE